ncbi:MAG: phosphatidylglycerophosphatase A [Acidobacteriota bacterium]
MRPGRRLLILLATGFGSGYSPIIPGTAGTLAALPVAWLAGRWLSPAAFTGLAILFVAPAILAAEVGGRHFRAKDPGHVVVDEWAGLFVTLAGHGIGWRELLVAFFAFRLFDIVKPFPARRLESLPGGTGIVLDDIAAGLYANLALWMVMRIW